MSLGKLAACFAVCACFAANLVAQSPTAWPKPIVTASRENALPEITLEQVSQLPPKLIQRVGALAFDGKDLWIFLYAAGGRYAKFDPATSTWELSQDPQINASVNRITGSFGPNGAAFVGDSIWLVGAHDDSFGSMDRRDTKRTAKAMMGRREELKGQQMFTDVTFDGEHVWATWSSLDYGADLDKNQLLLKMDRNTGEVVAEFPLPFGWVGDGARGLTWDGTRLWYANQSELRAFDAGGKTLAAYKLKGAGRISGMAWDGESLWLIEFEGKLWRLRGDNIPLISLAQSR